MGIARGPNIIKDGLVFGYDDCYNGSGEQMANGRYFKGPAHTNLLEDIDPSYTTTDTTNFKGISGEEVVEIPIVGKRTVKYVDYFNNYPSSGNCCPNLFHYHASDGQIPVDSSTSYTYSIIYKHSNNYTHPNFMYRYEYQSDGTRNTEAGFHSTSRRTNLGNGWYHAWGSFTTQSTTSYLVCYSFLYNYGTTTYRYSVAAISLVKNESGQTHFIIPPQLMLEPLGSVSNTASLIDLKRTNSIDVSDMSFTSTGQPEFDGTDDIIGTGISTAFTDFSCVVVFKHSVNTAWGRIVDKNYTNGFFMSSYFATGGSGYVGAGIIEPSSPHGQSLQYDNTKYNYFVVTRSGTTHTIYLNGSSNYASKTGSGAALNSSEIHVGAWYTNGSTQRFTGSIPVVKIYDRALTAEEVQQDFGSYKNRFNI